MIQPTNQYLSAKGFAPRISSIKQATTNCVCQGEPYSGDYHMHKHTSFHLTQQKLAGINAVTNRAAGRGYILRLQTY